VPESEHDKAGCRIGGRLDYIEAAIASIKQKGWNPGLIREAIASLESHGDHVSLCADLRAMLSAASETKGEDKILSDNELIEIRDSLLPSQGESFDMLAFGRLVAASAKRKALLKVEEVIMSSMSNSVLHLKEISRMIKE
jgi:hypothetical protein